MKVFEIKLKVYLLQDIMFENIQSEISSFIDGALGKNAELKKFHERNEFKNYCFDGLYPVEKNKVYSSSNIYTITLRTINKDLADFFVNKLVNGYSKTIKGLTCEIRIIPKKIIEKIYSITPAIMKDKNGYWKGNLSLQEYEKRIIENLIKKIGKDDIVASYGRQIAREEATILEKFAREFNYPDFDLLKSSSDIKKLGIKTFFMTNVCSAFITDEFWKINGSFG